MSKANGASLIDLQIMWHRLIAVVEEQAQVLLRTAFSPIVRECGDLSAGVFDLKGRMLAQAVTGTPGHVNSMAELVKHFIAHFPIETMKPGDAYITNDPWMGTGHLNDFVVTTPCFKDGKPVALFSCTSHLMDIGGIGFGPDATDVFMEGLYIPMLKLIDQGVVNETLMAMIRSQHAAADRHRGRHLFAGRLQRCRLRAPGRDDDASSRSTRSMTLGDYICDRSREAVLAEIAKLPKGSWRNSMVVDGYDAPVTLAATLTISDDGHPRRFRRHLGRLEVRHQRAAVLHHRLHRVRPRLRRRLADPEQCRLALAADGVGARGRDPQRAEAGAGRLAPHHRPDAARRGVRLPAPDHSRARAGGRHLLPVESQRARTDALAAPAAITDSRWR